MLIFEQNAVGFGEWHLVNDWRYYGSYTLDANKQLLAPCQRDGIEETAPISLVDAAEKCAQPQDFHYDHYRLLRAFLNDLEWQPLSAFALAKSAECGF